MTNEQDIGVDVSAPVSETRIATKREMLNEETEALLADLVSQGGPVGKRASEIVTMRSDAAAMISEGKGMQKVAKKALKRLQRGLSLMRGTDGQTE